MTVTMPDARSALLAVRDTVDDHAFELAERTCKDQPGLGAAVASLLATDRSAQGMHRLLPHALAGTDSTAATFVAALSRIWWTGAETLDDLTDGTFTGDLTTSSAMIAGIACLTVVPDSAVRTGITDVALREALTDEMRNATVHAAQGQLTDVESVGEQNRDQLWQRVMRGYAGKTGAAHGRDLAMTSLLQGESSSVVDGWRRFGTLYGVLRQMVNDRASLSTPDNEDFLNGTRTLLVAHATSAVDVLDLLAECGTSASARRDLLGLLMSHQVATGYDGKVHALRNSLSQWLGQAGLPPERAALVRFMVDTSTGAALIDQSGVNSDDQ